MGVADFDENYWQSQRSVADELADAAVLAAMKDTSADVRTILGHLMHNDSIPHEKLPPALQLYLKDSSQLPEWADMQQITVAQEIFDTYGMEICFVLLCRSLPECYTCANGAEVLHTTGRLAMHNTSYKPYTRRIMETLQFVMNVLQSGSFAPEGKAIETIQKIRLVHASIRYFIKVQDPDWDTNARGVPINQEDLVMTLNTFSVSVLSGLGTLGVELTPVQQESFVHCWAVVGHILGVSDSNIPRSVADATATQAVILKHQAKYSQIGSELARALLNFIHHISPGVIIPRTCSHATLMLLGPTLSGYLGMHSIESNILKMYERMFHAVMAALERMSTDSAVARAITKALTKSVIKGVIHHFNNNKDMGFTLPASLRS